MIGIEQRTVSLAFCFVIIIIMSGNNANNINITSFPHHSGIFFENLGSINFLSGHWTIISYFDIKDFWKQANSFHQASRDLTSLCQEKYCLRSIEILKALNDKTFKMNDLIRTKCHSKRFTRVNPAKRDRRSPMDFVGSVAHSLFGVLDHKYATKMEKVIGGVIRNEVKTSQLIQKHTSIIESTVNLVKSNTIQTEKVLSNTRNLLKIAMQNITTFSDKLSFMEIYTNLNFLMIDYMNTQHAIYTLLSSEKVKIDPALNSPKQLQQELDEIPLKLSELHSLPSTSLVELEPLINAAIFIGEDKIMFEFRIPLFHKVISKLYRIIPLPSNIGGKFMQVVSKNDYIIVSSDRYSFMSGAELKDCKEFNKEKVCTQTSYNSYIANKNNCEVDLLLNKKVNQCRFEISQDEEYFEQLHEPNTWLFSFKNKSALRISCEQDDETTKVLHGEGIMALNPKCKVVLNNQKLIVGKTDLYSTTLRLNSDDSVNPKSNMTMFLHEKPLDTILKDVIREIKDVKKKFVDKKNPVITTTNLSNHTLMKDIIEQTEVVKNLSNHTLIKDIFDQIQEVKAIQNQTIAQGEPDFFPSMDVHHYITYSSFILLIAFISALIICKFCCCKKLKYVSN